MADRGELLEYATVFGHQYGTPRAAVESALAEGRDVLFDIDWQGTQQLAQNARADLVSVFVLPPSTAELERRLRTRAQDSEEVVASRMAKAADEMSHWAEYDYIIVNRDIEESVACVQAILAAERLRRERLVGLASFVNDLRRGQ
jgi:guanylate kinase